MTSGQSTVHTVFNISMLEPATLNLIPDHGQPPPHPSLWWWTGNLKFPKSSTPRLTTLLCLIFIVSCLLDRVWGHWWRDSWIIASKLRHASELVVDFHSAYLAKSGPLSSLWLLTSEFLVSWCFFEDTFFMFKPIRFYLLQSHVYICIQHYFQTPSSCLSAPFPFPDSPTSSYASSAHSLFLMALLAFPSPEPIRNVSPQWKTPCHLDKAFVWSTKFWRFSSRH